MADKLYEPHEVIYEGNDLPSAAQSILGWISLGVGWNAMKALQELHRYGQVQELLMLANAATTLARELLMKQAEEASGCTTTPPRRRRPLFPQMTRRQRSQECRARLASRRFAMTA